MEMNPWPLGVPETRDFLEKTDSAWPSPQVKKKRSNVGYRSRELCE